MEKKQSEAKVLKNDQGQTEQVLKKNKWKKLTTMVRSSAEMIVNEMDSGEARDRMLNRLMGHFNNATLFTAVDHACWLALTSLDDSTSLLDDPTGSERMAGTHRKKWSSEFDKKRENIRSRVTSLYIRKENSVYNSFSDDELVSLGLSTYRRFIKKLLTDSLSAKDEQAASNLKGLAWSILAEDINKAMAPSGQPPLSPDWRSKMGKLILANTLSLDQVDNEFNNLVSGAEGVFKS